MAHGVRRLRPMTAKKLRFARWFVAAGWDVEEVADLFDVHDDAMADALEFGVAA
jgi:tryptophan synthase alpha subunit